MVVRDKFNLKRTRQNLKASKASSTAGKNERSIVVCTSIERLEQARQGTSETSHGHKSGLIFESFRNENIDVIWWWILAERFTEVCQLFIWGSKPFNYVVFFYISTRSSMPVFLFRNQFSKPTHHSHRQLFCNIKANHFHRDTSREHRVYQVKAV